MLLNVHGFDTLIFGKVPTVGIPLPHPPPARSFRSLAEDDHQPNHEKIDTYMYAQGTMPSSPPPPPPLIGEYKK